MRASTSHRYAQGSTPFGRAVVDLEHSLIEEHGERAPV